MNQEEKCWKEVVREENKRRLIFFFPLYIRISLGQWFYRITWGQCYCRCSSASENTDHVGSILCWDPLRFWSFWGFPKWHLSQSGVGSAAESQHTMALDRKDSISVCTFSWTPEGSTSISMHPNNFREDRRMHLRVLWAHSPVIYQFFTKSWCLSIEVIPRITGRLNSGMRFKFGLCFMHENLHF